MNEVKHTPGPWSVYEDDPVIIVNAEGSSLGEMTAGDPFIQSDTMLANARLAAAAPDLLLAAASLLRMILDYRTAISVEFDEVDNSILNAARAAIAKATEAQS